jgi:threonine aldolase
MAKRLERMLLSFACVEWVQKVEANMLFVKMPAVYADAVCAKGFAAQLGDVVRLVAAWDTQDEDICALQSLLQSI